MHDSDYQTPIYQWSQAMVNCAECGHPTVSAFARYDLWFCSPSCLARFERLTGKDK